jgi:hypothetical protein
MGQAANTYKIDPQFSDTFDAVKGHVAAGLDYCSFID